MKTSSTTLIIAFVILWSHNLAHSAHLHDGKLESYTLGLDGYMVGIQKHAAHDSTLIPELSLLELSQLPAFATCKMESHSSKYTAKGYVNFH